MWPCDLVEAINKWAELYPNTLILRILPNWDGIVFQTTSEELYLFTKEKNFKKI
jgi:hypothetical protein